MTWIPAKTFWGKAAPMLEYYVGAGATFAVSTNCPDILARARENLLPLEGTPPAVVSQLRLGVDESDASGPPWPKPYFGGLDHMVFAGFGSSSALLLDLRGCRGVGLFAPHMAHDTVYWSNVILPVVFGALGPSMGIVPLHCACVVREGDQAGLLLAGGSGVGKSTLAAALAQLGFGLLSDDWTYFTVREGRSSAWGLPTTVKLLPDARSHFRELVGHPLGLSLNGELSFEVDPKKVFRVRRSLRCEPRWLLFLEREAGSEFSFKELSPQEAAERLDQDTPPLWPELVAPRQKVIAALSRCRCGLLRHDASPEEAAKRIAELLQLREMAS